jgi:RNA polymerase sigma-70 factor (ECF subfamily)
MTAQEQSHGWSLDVELVDAAIGGDPAAFREIVLRFDPGLRSLAFRLLRDRDRMDDVLQEAYVKAFRALPRFNRDARLGTWLYRITYNACLDELRDSGRREWAEFDDESHEVMTPDPSDGVTDRMLVEEAISRLSPGYRTVLILVDGQGFDYQAAGEILGVAEGTVASRLHRARQAMYRALTTERSPQ